jgi:hypothetical protein
LLLLFSVPFLLTGCAGLQMKGSPVTALEADGVRAAFQEMTARQEACKCVDAEVDVTLAVSWWVGGRTVTISGYLQAMPPSFLKFTGINTFGQPLYVFITDGDRFQSVIVQEAKVFEGDVRSEFFHRYFPPRLKTMDLFAWFTGGFSPAEREIVAVQADRQGQGYWLDLAVPGVGERVWLLFDPAAGLVRRHLIYGSRNSLDLQVIYESYNAVGACLYPGNIVIEAPAQKSSVRVTMRDMLACEELPIAFFNGLQLPGFEQVIVH